MRIEQADPKRVIYQAYALEDVTEEECRTIFLNWVLGLPDETAPKPAIKRLIAEYGKDDAHPMTSILHQGLEGLPTSKRRGGRRARFQGDHN